jgi:hypothetical protein
VTNLAFTTDILRVVQQDWDDESQNHILVLIRSPDDTRAPFPVDGLATSHL